MFVAFRVPQHSATVLFSGYLAFKEVILGNKLYVGNLPFAATDDSLQQIFAQAGTVASAKVITDRETGRSKGFGFVEMSNEAQAADAISKFHGADYDGRAMTVAEAKPMVPRDSSAPRGNRY